MVTNRLFCSAWLILALVSLAHGGDEMGRVDVTRFGATPDDGRDDTAAVQAAIRQAHGIAAPCLTFPKGQYDFGLSPTTGRVAMLFEGFTNLTVDGQGSTFVFHGPVNPLRLFRCNNTQLANFRIDWARPPFSQGRVLAATNLTFDVEVDPAYPVTNHPKIEALMDYDADTRLPIGNLDVFGSAIASAELIRPQVLRITLQERHEPEKMAHIRAAISQLPGRLIVLRHNVYGLFGVDLGRCVDTRLSDVSIYSVPGMGLHANQCRDISLQRVEVRIKPDSGRLMSTSADCQMYTFCSGTISIQDSFFEGMGDDGLNIYTKYRTVTRVTGSNRIEAVMGNATWRGPTPEPGEVIVFHGGADLKEKGSATVKSAAWGPRAAVFTVEFSQPLPAGLATNDLILCPAYLPRARVSHCTFRGMRARAMLFSTYDVQVEHCRIEGPTHVGIMLLGGRRHNFQGPAPHGVVIRDCDFIGCGGAAIYAYGSVLNPGWDVLRDVTIADNRIREDPRLLSLRFKKDHPDWAHWSSALCLKNVDGAVIRGNTIDGYATAVFLDNDRNVVVADNVCTNAATVVFDADRTSGVSLTGNRGLTPAATAHQFDSDLQYINDLR